MAVRRLYEPLCIAFGTTVSSPTVPTYQLYDLPHKFTPRLYMESEDPNLVLREIGVWAGWEQAGSANTRSFLLDLLKDEDAHDNFLVREAGPTRFRRVRGIIVVLTQKHLRIVRTKGSRLGGLRFQLTYQQACLVHGTKGARGPRERFVYCHRTFITAGIWGRGRLRHPCSRSRDFHCQARLFSCRRVERPRGGRRRTT